MDEFEFLQDNMMAFLDGYEALPELSGTHVAASGTDSATRAGPSVPFVAQATQQQLQQIAKHKPTHQHEQEEAALLALHETEQLLNSLEVASFLETTLPSSPASFHENAHGAVVVVDQSPGKQPFVSTGVPTAVDSGEDECSVDRGGSKPCKSKNLSRERLKNELTYLRQKVIELEEELRILRPGSTLGGSAMSLVAVDRKKAILPVWQRIAERQLEGRHKAEAENTRLKNMLEGQIKLAKGLEQMLRKRPNVALMNGDARTGKKARVESDDDSIYEMLMDGLEPAYKRMDAVFRANGLYDTVDESIRHARVKTRQDSMGDEILYLELTDVYLIPFDLHMTGHAAWRSVTLQFLKENHAIYQNVKQPEDTIAVKFQVKSHRNGVEILVDTKLVMRRYIEKERMVLVWRTLSEGEHQLSGMHTDETGWCVLQKIPASASSTVIGTVMKSCVHVIPKSSGSVAHEGQPEIGVLTNLVIDSYEEDVIAINKTMENLLLEEALSISGGSADRKARMHSTSTSKRV